MPQALFVVCCVHPVNQTHSVGQAGNMLLVSRLLIPARQENLNLTWLACLHPWWHSSTLEVLPQVPRPLWQEPAKAHLRRWLHVSFPCLVAAQFRTYVSLLASYRWSKTTYSSSGFATCPDAAASKLITCLAKTPMCLLTILTYRITYCANYTIIYGNNLL